VGIAVGRDPCGALPRPFSKAVDSDHDTITLETTNAAACETSIRVLSEDGATLAGSWRGTFGVRTNLHASTSFDASDKRRLRRTCRPA